MKKIVAMALIGAAATAYGVVNVDWMASAGFYFSAAPSLGILGDGTGGSTVAQLIYSIDGDVDDATIGGGVSGDDVVWATVPITEDGTGGNGDEWATFIQNYQQVFVSGNVYARIFQDGDIQSGDWYFYTPMLSLQDITGLSFPQTIQMNTDLTNGNAIDSGATTAQVIPEPATFMLLALGGGLAWLVRQRQAFFL